MNNMRSKIWIFCCLCVFRILIFAFTYYSMFETEIPKRIFSIFILVAWLGLQLDNLLISFILLTLRIFVIIGFVLLLKRKEIANIPYLSKSTKFFLIFEILGVISGLVFLFFAKGFSIHSNVL